MGHQHPHFTGKKLSCDTSSTQPTPPPMRFPNHQRVPVSGLVPALGLGGRRTTSCPLTSPCSAPWSQFKEGVLMEHYLGGVCSGDCEVKVTNDWVPERPRVHSWPVHDAWVPCRPQKGRTGSILAVGSAVVGGREVVG